MEKNQDLGHILLQLLTLTVMTNRPPNVQVSLDREKTLQDKVEVIQGHQKTLRCDSLWGRTFHSEVCRFLNKERMLYAHLSYAYWLKCYDGPGYDCDQDLPPFEKKYGAFVDLVKEYN